MRVVLLGLLVARTCEACGHAEANHQPDCQEPTGTVLGCVCDRFRPHPIRVLLEGGGDDSRGD